MNAVLAFMRLDLRRRWRSLLVLTLLVAMSGGVIIATVAGARRTDTVLTRLDNDIAPADIMVLPNQPGFHWGPVRRLPSVERLGTFVLTEGVEPQGVGLSYDEAGGFPAGDLIQNVQIDKPKLISGRLANPHNPYEIDVSPGFISRYGKTVTLKFPSKAQVATLHPGQSFPPGTTYQGQVVHLHVVGVGVNTFDLGPGGSPVYMPTHAFFTHFIKPTFPYFENARVQLKGGEAAIPAFTKQLAQVTGNPNIQIDNQHQAQHSLQQAASFTAVSWLLFALIAFVASLILLGQAFARFCGAAAGDLGTLSALGMDSRQAKLAAASGPALASVVGALLAVGTAYAMSPLFPTALPGEYEPNPGLRADPLVLGLGLLGIVAVGLTGSYLTARSAVSNTAPPQERASIIATTARRLGFGVTAVLGTRFALEPGQGKTRVPVRPALVGAVAGVLGVVGAMTFRTGLSDAVDNPHSYGQTFSDVGFVSEGPPQKNFAAALAQAKSDPDLAALDDMRVSVLDVNGLSVSTTSITPIVGHVTIVTLSGRPPSSADEISLGPQTATQLGVHVGSTVTVEGHAMTVTGITFVPENPHNDYTNGAWLTTAGFGVVRPSETNDKFHEVRFNFKPGISQAAGLASLPKNLAPGGAGPSEHFIEPEQQGELRSVRLEPLLLGAFLLLLAIGAVGHGLATAVRRRRHDVAVLRALGLTRGQSRLIVVAQATVLALVGLAAGIPLGMAAGRTGWRVLANATPVFYVAPVALFVILLSVPVTIGIANLLATVPARRAARLRVNEILRAE